MTLHRKERKITPRLEQRIIDRVIKERRKVGKSWVIVGWQSRPYDELDVRIAVAHKFKVRIDQVSTIIVLNKMGRYNTK